MTNAVRTGRATARGGGQLCRQTPISRYGWRWLATGIGASLVLTGCGSFESGPSSRNSPPPRGVSTPSVSPSNASPTISVTLRVTQLPTTNAGGSSLGYPGVVTVTLPAAFVSHVAAYGVAGTVLIGPAHWTGRGAVGADGGSMATLRPDGGAHGGGARMVFSYDGGCVGCSWSDASAYFPMVARAIGGTGQVAESPPAGLTSVPLGSGIMAYSLPNSAGGLQTNGVAYTNLPSAAASVPVFENLSLTLPETEHPLATVILNAFVTDLAKFQAPPTTPTVAPIPSSASWITPTADACEWGQATLAQDRTLDLQGASEYPQWASWYAKTAAWWQRAETDLQGLCGTAPEPTEAACQSDLGHFEEAYVSHEDAGQNADQTGVPDNTPQTQAWNQQWMSNYVRLENIFESTGCAQPEGGGAPPATGPPI